jgi:hypothetical protein
VIVKVQTPGESRAVHGLCTTVFKKRPVMVETAAHGACSVLHES